MSPIVSFLLVNIDFVFVWLWAGYGIFGPWVREGKSATHNALWVKLPSAYRNGNYGPAVKVHEVGEWRFCKLVGVCVGSALYNFDAAPFWTVLAMLVADSLTRLVPARFGIPRSWRWDTMLDYAGHRAEIIFAIDADKRGYVYAEIDRMARARKRAHLTKSQIASRLERFSWLGRLVWMFGK